MADISIGSANIAKIRLAEQSGDPATPASGFTYLYEKSDGLYIIQDDSTVSGPFLASVTAADIEMAKIGTPTYSTVQQMQDIFHSSGWVSGGGISDAGSGNIIVGVGTGFIRATASSVAQILFFNWAALGSTAIPSDTIRYVGVEYNAGSPQVVVRTSENWDFLTDFALGVVVNQAGTLHISTIPIAVGDHASEMIQRLFQTMPRQRDIKGGGAILSETGTRNLAVTAGAFWDGLTRFPITALDTSVADTFDDYYVAAGTWTVATGLTQWENSVYNDIATGLVAMAANRYAVRWWYLDIESPGSLCMVYGRDEYTSQTAAEAEAPPDTFPDRLVVQGVLIARTIFQKSASSSVLVSTAYATVFTPGADGDISSAVILAPDSLERNLVQPSGDYHAMVLKANASQAVNMLEVRSSADVDLVTINQRGRLRLHDISTTPPLSMNDRSSAPSNQIADDIYLDNGANTASGNPGFRRYTGAAWQDIGGGVPVTSQAGTPSSTPNAVGDLNIDTTNDRSFSATDTTGASDWKRTDSAKVFLATGSLGSPAASVTISGWPTDNNAYEYLELRVNQVESDAAAVNNDNVLVTFNSDTTATNYVTPRIIGSTASLSYNETIGTLVGLNMQRASAAAQSDANHFASCQLKIFEPESASVYRNVLFEAMNSSNTAGELAMLKGGGTWRNNANAITSITLTPATGTNWLAGLTWSLYGVYKV